MQSEKASARKYLKGLREQIMDLSKRRVFYQDLKILLMVGYWPRQMVELLILMDPSERKLPYRATQNIKPGDRVTVIWRCRGSMLMASGVGWLGFVGSLWIG